EGTLLVEGQRHGAQSRALDEVPVGVQAVGLDGQGAGAPGAQDVGETAQAVGEPGADDDVFGVGAHAPDPREVVGQGLAQFRPAARIAVAEGVVGGGGERAAGGPEPGGAGEGGEVRRAGDEVVGQPAGRARGGRPVGGRGHRAVGDVGAGALPGGEPALGDQVGVGVGDGVAGDAQVGGERAGGGQPGAGGEAAGADGVAQGVGQSAAQAGAAAFEVEVDAVSGP